MSVFHVFPCLITLGGVVTKLFGETTPAQDRIGVE